jgi:hypothetical protein
MTPYRRLFTNLSRRFFAVAFIAGAILPTIRSVAAEDSETTGKSTDIIEFERTLVTARDAYYRHRTVDIIETGYRPVGGKVADFAVAERDGRYHFYYIERRLTEGTPFYPGHEMYFGHASTADFVEWEVHDPVLLVRPGTWEGAHVWAPCIVRRSNEYIMAYTGVNRHISQDIGLASSTDLFEWKRWESNPISPCKDKAWSHWRADEISSCRDPDILFHDGRYWMIFTANTKEGASCIALVSTEDFKQWRDHGPICVGPASGYEPRLEGGHPQGSLESASLLHKGGRWLLLVKCKVRDSNKRSWIIESDRVDSFPFDQRREFWPGAMGIEVLEDRGDRSLLATFTGSQIRLGVADWAAAPPTGRFLENMDELKAWLE